MSEFKNPGHKHGAGDPMGGGLCIAAYFFVPFVFQGVLGELA